MQTNIARFAPSDDMAKAVAETRRNGVVIVEDLFSPAEMDALAEQLDPALDAQTPGGGEFFGFQKRSVNAIFARGKVFSDTLLLNERLLELADGILLPEKPMAASSPAVEAPSMMATIDQSVGPNCHHYHLNATVAMQVCPGGGNQMLHRDEWRYLPYMHRDPAGPELTLAFMVAVTDFTAENGATRYIPGSNAWAEGKRPSEDEVIQATMGRGSVAAWLGSVYHGLGTNHTGIPRTGIIFSFGVNYLIQEENQFAAVPAQALAELPERARQLIGYRSSTALNYIPGLDDTHVLDGEAHHV